MYTQCPECSIAFRVTADVLRQAAGKVRCGGCGHAFNALAYLSESRPEQKPEKAAEEALPELTPEPLPDDGVPQAISAEQSAALLKTLDELAGSDIRIEDTGVEWRVLDADEVGEAADDAVAIDIDVEDQPEIDEILEDSPTPVDQFLTDTPPQIDAPEIFAEGVSEASRTPVEELRFDDNTPLPDDFDLDAAIYGTASDEVAPPPAPKPEPAPVEAAQVDLDLTEPGEWTDILDEFEDLVDDLADDVDALAGDDVDELDDMVLNGDLEELEDDFAGGIETDNKVPLDMDSQFALQAEAMGIDISGVHESLDEAPEDEPTNIDIEEDLDTLLQDPDADDRDIEALLEEEIVDEIDEEHADLFDEDEQDDDAEDSAQLELIDAFEEETADEELAADDVEDREDNEHYVPPLTEEEQTINMQIDQDLLAIAVEDEDGFASTMVLTEGAAAEPELDNKADDDEPEEPRDFADTGSGFETIIMEGEFVRSDLDREKLAADAAAVAKLAGAAAAEREAEKAARKREINYGMVAGLVVLVLVLLGQFVHQSRNTLATIPAFNDTVGPLYRAIGQPLSPDWDITGWRFEATQGQADEANENLTIYSRIGNKSDYPLPYPLISVSLTDRFEDVIGNRVLDPADYLANDLDPRKLVQPGDTFNAAITIHSPGADAVSFRLRACYRATGGQLRCKEDGFK